MADTHFPRDDKQKDFQELSLDEAAAHMLEECRMVLPGIQALFGFQFVAVFNSAFSDKLTPGQQDLHLFALLCVALAAALVLTPAALHRQTQPRSVSARFLSFSSHMLMWSMLPLAVGTSADVYLVARIITHSAVMAAASAVGALAMFTVLWVIVPRAWGHVR